MRKHTNLLLFTSLLLMLMGCKSQERYLYVEDAPHNTPLPITNNYDASIYTNDLLYIYVSSQTPESVIPFNEETNRLSGTRTSKTSGFRRGNMEIKGYQVSQSGYILFPVLGRIEAAGKSRAELGHDIETMLIEGGYVNDPVVTVDLLNFHVTVIGEVKKPRLIHATGSRLTIFEALAQAGDVTINGMRTNVVVVRSGKDYQIVDTLDLTRKEIFNSPYYYLQQNDIVFVEPTEKRKKEAWRNEDWPRYLDIGVQSLRVAYHIIHNIIRVQKLK